MRVDVEFIKRWGETLNALSTTTASFRRGHNAKEVVEDFLRIGAQLPFDPACTPWDELYGYERFGAAVEANEFLPVYEFLQRETGQFASLQRSMGLHMGLFAYVDFKSGALRYLYGPGDYRDDSRKTQAHFALKSFFEFRRPMGGDVWLEEPSWHYARMAESFYYSRRSEGKDGQALKLGFVRILESERGEQRSEWERGLGIIYAPSGEIDACILCWLLLHVERLRPLLAAWCKQVAGGYLAAPEVASFELKLPESATQRSRPLRDRGHPPVRESYYWGQGRSKTLPRWLNDLGLLARGGPGGKPPVVTPKGRAMVEWLVAYLNRREVGEPVALMEGKRWLESETCSQAAHDFLNLAARAYPATETGGADASEATASNDGATNSEDLARKTSARGTESAVPKGQRLEADGQVRAGASDDLEFRALIASVRLLLSWDPPERAGRALGGEAEVSMALEPAYVRFEAACRMTLRAHLILRAGTRYRGMIENLPRAWIVFPVLYVDDWRLGGIPRLQANGPAARKRGALKPAGFFLGTLRDLDEDGSSSPSLRRRGQETLSRKLAAIRALIQPLAEIENRETYFLDIAKSKEEADRRAKTTELIGKVLQAIATTVDPGQLSAVRRAIDLVMLNSGEAGEVFVAALTRFAVMRAFYRQDDVFVVLHNDEPIGDRVAHMIIAARETERLARGLAARDRGYGKALGPEETGQIQLEDSADTPELATFARRLNEIADSAAQGGQVEDELNGLTEGTDDSLGFKQTLRPGASRAELVSQYISRELAADEDTETLRQALVKLQVPACSKVADPYGILRTERWRKVLAAHFIDRSYRAEFFGPLTKLPAGLRGLWVIIDGKCRAEHHLAAKGAGGYAANEGQDLLATILRGSTGRYWVESMVPHYYEPCLLENRNASGWSCWDLAEYVRGGEVAVPEATVTSLAGAPLGASGVRLLVRVDLSSLTFG